MPRGTYWIVGEQTEDRYGPADTVEAAGRLVRDLLSRGLAHGPLSVESDVLVVRQYVVEEGGVTETTGAETRAEAVS